MKSVEVVAEGASEKSLPLQREGRGTIALLLFFYNRFKVFILKSASIFLSCSFFFPVLGL